MKVLLQQLRLQASRLVVICILVPLYLLSRLPQLPGAERAAMTTRFQFTQQFLPGVPGPPHRSIREVHPDLQRIDSWISSVGASVALNDLDGDGLPNDICYVDTRTDQVIVGPVPGTEARYQPFTLEPDSLPYDKTTMAPMGVLPCDLNEDGRMDILVYYWGRTPVLFLRRAETSPGIPTPLSRASYLACEVYPQAERWYTNAATVADLDGDGHLDLVIGNYFPDGAHILDAHAHNFEQMQDSMSRAFNGGRKHFLLWSGAAKGVNPSVHFQEADPGLPPEAMHGWTLAVGACDLDGDLLPEIYLANDFGPDRLLSNRSTPGHLRFALVEGQRTLTTPSSKVLGRDSFKGMGVDFADLNGDGRPDIFVSNIADSYALEESHLVFMSTDPPQRLKEGVAPYVDRSEALGLSRSGWGWDVKMADFDNCSYPEVIQATGFVKGDINYWPQLHELAMGNDALLHVPGCWPRIRPGVDLSGHGHNPFFVRDSKGYYYDLAQEIGLGESHVSRGIAVADVDGDGRLDFAIANQWEPSIFYHNVSPHPGAFLGLHLQLPVFVRSPATTKTRVRKGHPDAAIAGRPAIGASAILSLPDGRRLAAQVDGGNGHSGRRSPELHFGLGAITGKESFPIEIHWRDSIGHIHSETLLLKPGWYTVLLGSDGERSAGI